MNTQFLALPVNAALALVLTLGLGACGQKTTKTTIAPTSFAGNVAKTQKEVPAEPVVIDSKKEVDEGNPDEGAQLALENKREKLLALQEKLKRKEEEKNSLASRITAVDTELATVVVPTKNNAAAAIYLYYGDYASAALVTARQNNAIAAAEKKKAQLTALSDQMKVDLATVTEESAALEKEVDALAKEVEAAAAVTPVAEDK